MDSISGCISENGMNVSEKIESDLYTWSEERENVNVDFCGSRIGEVEEYKYLGVTVKDGLNGGFRSMANRMVDVNGVLGMVKYAATRSGSINL